ncbi:hypothetical protein L7E55_16610 [Pelotomaculum isophthalicicum JI]|uniref:Uncharacterized protein n=1 Tax=Pelotomaculum isophthalicicum JI TaxID=947010 RepID=A0A9X4H4P5_9FIRM|nr:hypothetical protein [Pelotomaculum isophthalicicum]MDF9409946.1 hypothetical protein [Pelotomaculum isophthalicicum JI]
MHLTRDADVDIKTDGLLTSAHLPAEKLVWSLFAAVINRYRGRSSASDPWSPGNEEFATVLNRLRGK